MTVLDSRINLDFRGLSLSFVRVFLNQTIPRSNDEIIEVGRTMYGTFTINRRVYEEYHRFEFSTLINLDYKQTLDAMFFEHNLLVRTKSRDPSPALLLTDCTQRFTERSPRTRAIAGSPYDDIITTSGAVDFISYFAKYWVYFEKAPVYTKTDNYYQVELSFIEENRKATPDYDG